MRNEKAVEKAEDKKFSMGHDVKIDNRTRDEVFEVKHNGVTLEFTANLPEAMAAQRHTQGSALYSINMQSGRKTLRA